MKYNLFVDESGSHTLKNHSSSPCYILCGVMVREDNRQQLYNRAAQVKYKHWGSKQINLHSAEIGRREGEFKILKKDTVEKEFIKDLKWLLSTPGYQLFAVLIDSKKGHTKGWDSNKVFKETSTVMMKNFILALIARESSGRFVAESATSEKDMYFHKAGITLLSKGIPSLNVDQTQAKEALTEISFVTKKNDDIEEQIADLMAYAAKLIFLKTPDKDLTDYDKMIIEAFNSKLFHMNRKTRGEKRKLYSAIDSFKVLP